jgi:hypothetical protein
VKADTGGAEIPEVTPSASPNDRAKDKTSQPGDRIARPGVVAGAVLRGARLSASVSEANLAAASGVAEDTVRSWEDGSSPLAAVSLPHVEGLEAALRDAGANPRIVADLGAGAWCDLVILAVTGHEDTTCLTADPVTSEDAFSELLAWSLVGHVPARYRPYAAPVPLLTNSILAERVIQTLDATDARLAAGCRLAF